MAEVLYQRFTQSDNQEYEADNQERLFQSSSLPQRDAWSPLPGGMLLPGARQHRNGAMLNTAPQGAAAHPKDPGATKKKQKEKNQRVSSRREVPCEGQEAELNPQRAPSPWEHHFITGEGTEMGMETAAGCNTNHFIFAFHLLLLSVITARVLQNAPASGGA